MQPFPEPSGKWPVSTGGVGAPRWRADGKELYFIAPDGKLMAAPVTAKGTALEIGKPVPLFPTRLTYASTFRPYYIPRDGRFLIDDLLEESAAPITLLLNWNPPPRK